jgi:hypothetical protein
MTPTETEENGLGQVERQEEVVVVVIFRLGTLLIVLKFARATRQRLFRF